MKRFEYLVNKYNLNEFEYIYDKFLDYLEIDEYEEKKIHLENEIITEEQVKEKVIVTSNNLMECHDTIKIEERRKKEEGDKIIEDEDKEIIIKPKEKIYTEKKILKCTMKYDIQKKLLLEM